MTVTSTFGQGSVFSMRLPATVSVPSTIDVLELQDLEEISPATAAPAASEDAKTVLVIDDDPVARDLIGRVLTKKGLQVVTTSNGQEGLRLAQQLAPAAITLDVEMPGIDGWSVLRTLQATPALAAIPVVMLTIDDDKKTAYTLGASAYLNKPIDPERLTAILLHYMNLPHPDTA